VPFPYRKGKRGEGGGRNRPAAGLREIISLRRSSFPIIPRKRGERERGEGGRQVSFEEKRGEREKRREGEQRPLCFC